MLGFSQSAPAIADVAQLDWPTFLAAGPAPDKQQRCRRQPQQEEKEEEEEEKEEEAE